MLQEQWHIKAGLLQLQQNIGNDIRRTWCTGNIQQSREERSQPNENDGFVKGTVKKIGMATANAVHTEVVHEHVPIMESARAGFVGVADTRMAVIGGAKPLNVLNPINTISSSRRQVIHDNANQARLDNGINQMDFSGRRVQPVQTVSNVEANVSHRVASGVSQERINVMNSVIRDGIVKNIVTQRVSTPVQSSNDVSHSGEKFNISTAMNLFNEKGRFTEQEAQNIAKNYTSNKKDVEIFTSLISTNFSHCAPKEAAEKIQHSLETNYSERMQDTEFRNSAYKLLEDVAKIDEPLDM